MALSILLKFKLEKLTLCHLIYLLDGPKMLLPRLTLCRKYMLCTVEYMPYSKWYALLQIMLF